jgi:hypothetical protein
MYYLNAFNEMQRKRRQNMMGGEGNDYGVGTTAPSGPMGLGPAQDRNAFRDTLNSMSPMSRFAVGMMPVIGPAFNAGRLVDAGISAYQNSQLAPSRDARERAQDQFRASEISEMNAPMQNTPQQSFRGSELADSRSLNTPQQSFQTNERAGFGQAGPEYGPAPTTSLDSNPYEGGFYGPGAFNENAVNMGGRMGSVNVEGNALVGGPVSQPSLSVTTFDGVPYSPPSAVEQQALNFSGESVGFGGGFGGGVGTGDFGGSPADAADMGYAHGGMVDARHLKGRAPAPDDGYGALQGGEYVITKAAVEKYGKRLLDAINNGTFR